MQILRSNYAKTLTRQVFGETLKINCKEPHEAALCRIVIAMPGERNERNVLRMSSLSLLWNAEVPQSMKWELAERCNHQYRHPSRPTAREELGIRDTSSRPGRTPWPTGESRVSSRACLEVWTLTATQHTIKNKWGALHTWFCLGIKNKPSLQTSSASLD